MSVDPVRPLISSTDAVGTWSNGVDVTSRPSRGNGIGQVILESSPILSDALREAAGRTTHLLLQLQNAQGYWVGELEADTTLEADSIKLWHLLDRVDSDKQQRFVRTILKNQLPEGGWPIYAGGPPELNATVKAYVALKLAGYPTGDPVLVRTRQVILGLGGLERVNSFEKVYLALFGCYPWDQVPALPPELTLLPNWFPFNIYEISYWSRTILVPLAVVYATRPASKTTRLNLDELWVDPKQKRAQVTNFQKGGAFWRAFFLLANRVLQAYEASPWKPWRKKALRFADQWITDRLIETDGLGAIFPAMMNAVFALKGLGYEDGDPIFEQSVREMECLELPAGAGLKVQPCFSPIWDTGLAVYILGKAGSDKAKLALRRAADWLLTQEVRRWGDWLVKNPSARPGGWTFEFRNPVYPDVDDTAQVLLGLCTMQGGVRSLGRYEGAFRRGLDWVLSMQNRDGGWSSFDKNNNCVPLTHFPFADHNAMLDPSACDITGRILELLALAEFSRNHPSVERAVAFLKAHQEPDGTWLGRWGVSYIYGTWLALRGLKGVGEPMDSAPYQRAGEWLKSKQNPDGGWGENCRSYDDPFLKGDGPSTASQTAWALMALMSLGKAEYTVFHRGLSYLVNSQQPDGNWEEGEFTGTGFPRVFYLKYHLYRTYFPLLALSEAQDLLKASEVN